MEEAGFSRIKNHQKVFRLYLFNFLKFDIYVIFLEIPAGMKMKEHECDSGIPWCDIVINKVTLEVKYDYSKTQGMVFFVDTLF
jgi:hypothetical protein